MKILRKRLTYSLNESISDEAVYRTAPATPGLLIRGWQVLDSTILCCGQFRTVLFFLILAHKETRQGRPLKDKKSDM